MAILWMLRDLCDNREVCVEVTGSPWQLRRSAWQLRTYGVVMEITMWQLTGLSWQSRGLRGSYGVTVAITRSAWQLGSRHGNHDVYVAVTGSSWQSRGLRGSYGVTVAITKSAWQLGSRHGNHEVYVAATGSSWQSRGLCGSYGVIVAITRSAWQLRGLRGNYEVRRGSYGLYTWPHFALFDIFAHPPVYVKANRTPHDCHVVPVTAKIDSHVTLHFGENRITCMPLIFGTALLFFT